MKLSLRFCLPLLALAPLVALAQPKKAAPALAPAPVPAATNAGQVDISNAPDGTATYVDDAQGVARITKNVVITQSGENLVVYAQEALYNRARNQANASGQLRVVTRDSTIRGQKLFADFNERQFTISGSVTITSHGKNDGAAAGLRAEGTKKPIRVLCNQVVWDYDTRQATATGNIQILQGANKGTCNSIIYSENENIVQLLGDVRFGDDKNRTLVGPKIIIYLDQNIVSGGRVRMKFPPLSNPNGAASPTRAPKAVVAVPPAPKLPSNIFGDVVPPPPLPTAGPVATEEPVPTPIPEEPADAAPAN